MQIKPYLIKYLLLAVGVTIMRGVLIEIAPDLFSITTIGDGFTQTRTSFFGLFQENFFNIIIAVVMYYDLQKWGRNRIVIPILAIISLTAGLALFSLVFLEHLISKHERI